MFLDIHTHIEKDDGNSVFNVILGKDTIPSNKRYSLGIHPWLIGDENKLFDDLENELKKNDSNFIFIGECGLDKIRGANEQIQLTTFKKHIALSEQFKKPLLIHCVKRFDVIQKLKKELNPSQAWVIHGFNKNRELANQLFKQGFYISFGTQVLTSNRLQEILLNLPLTSVFFETDTDKKPTINEIYKFVSVLLNIDLEVLKQQTIDNLWHITG